MKLVDELRVVQQHNDAMVGLESLSVLQAEAHHLEAFLVEALSLALTFLIGLSICWLQLFPVLLLLWFSIGR